MHQNIGEKVKELRTGSRMTLKELSEATDLSTGFLSQFERGLTTIAIDSLSKIAGALGVEITYFFDSTASGSGIVRKSYQHNVTQVMNSTIYRSLVQSEDNKQVVPKLVEIMPMESLLRLCHECYEADTGETPDHYNMEVEPFAHDGEEFLYVLEGILTLILDDEAQALYPGDSAYYRSGIRHNWANHTSKPVKFLAMNIPSEFCARKPD
ncbi:XRE family transcriptional regulator [Desulfovibrio sp. OttesenSCG-928-C06]|nr:XRE family transcriptional regulator [Desulfovibrio sp. OttesenSCG-928-C06]